MTKKEKAFLRQARGPHEVAYEGKLIVKFLAKPGLKFDEVMQHLFDLVRGDMKGLTMPTKRTSTELDLRTVDL